QDRRIDQADRHHKPPVSTARQQHLAVGRQNAFGYAGGTARHLGDAPEMRISVIVPLFNAARYVIAAIDSILAQSRPADEILVVDDGSTDGGAEALASYGPRLRLLRQENRGPGSAVNRGLRKAGGEALAFLDADDLWTPDKLERQCAALAADRSLD